MNSNPNTNPVNCSEPWPGTFDVRCTFSYVVPPNYNNPQQVTIATSVTIAPPNGVRITKGLNSPVAINSGVTVIFQLQSNGQDVGPYCTGYAQELVTNKVQFGVPYPSDTEWTPPVSQPSNLFYENEGKIFDYKVTNSTPPYVNWLFGTVFYTCTQNIRMLFTDPCGNQRIYSCGSVNLARQKIDVNTWQIFQQ